MGLLITLLIQFVTLTLLMWVKPLDKQRTEQIQTKVRTSDYPIFLASKEDFSQTHI
jgi:hypothetical protein